MSDFNPSSFLASSQVIHEAVAVQQAISGIAKSLTNEFAETRPLVMTVMGGGLVFAGQLIPQLQFPLTLDYVHVSRYNNHTEGHELVWTVLPKDNIKGRTVLVLDDILDEGITLAAIKEKCLALGAKKVVVVVLVEKTLTHQKPIKADFVGLPVPNVYVFGYGMDIHGWWRNLPAIYAYKG